MTAAPLRTSALASALCLAAAACSAPSAPPALQVSETDSAGVVLVDIEGPVSEVPVWRLGSGPQVVVSGAAEPFFSDIGEVGLLHDGRIVIEDDGHDAIYLFASDGSLERVLGDQGDGPGQFRAVTRISVTPGDTIYAYDRRHARLSTLDPDTGFLTSQTYGQELTGRPPLDVLPLGDDRVAIRAYAPAGPDGRRLPVRVTTQETLGVGPWTGEEIDSAVSYPGGVTVYMEWALTTASWTPEAFVAAAPGRIVHGTGDRFALTIRDSRLRTVRVVRWAGWSKPVTDEELAAARTWYEDVATLPDEYRTQVVEAQYTRDQLPAHRPALGSVAFVDASGEIWVTRYEGPGPDDAIAPRWYVLGPQGHPIGLLDLPRGVRLAAVSGDRVAVIVSDELDVESLHVFALER